MAKKNNIIGIEKVSNGYIITVNGKERSVATNRADVKEYFGELLATNIQCVKDGQIATLEITTNIENEKENSN